MRFAEYDALAAANAAAWQQRLCQPCAVRDTGDHPPAAVVWTGPNANRTLLCTSCARSWRAGADEDAQLRPQLVRPVTALDSAAGTGT